MCEVFFFPHFFFDDQEHHSNESSSRLTSVSTNSLSTSEPWSGLRLGAVGFGGGIGGGPARQHF